MTDDFIKEVAEKNPEIAAAIQAEFDAENVNLSLEVLNGFVAAVISGSLGGNLNLVLQASGLTPLTIGAINVGLSVIPAVGGGGTGELVKDGSYTFNEFARDLAKGVVGYGAGNLATAAGLSLGGRIAFGFVAGWGIGVAVDDAYEWIMDAGAITKVELDGYRSIECKSDLEEFIDEHWEQASALVDWRVKEEGSALGVELIFGPTGQSDLPMELEVQNASGISYDIADQDKNLFFILCKKIKSDFRYIVTGDATTSDVVINFADMGSAQISNIATGNNQLEARQIIYAMNDLQPFVRYAKDAENYNDVNLDEYSDQYIEDRSLYLYINPAVKYIYAA